MYLFQIGLVDLLNLVGIKPDNFIGHSMGELGCAYADGCLTAEQVISAAYHQGLACTESQPVTKKTVDIGIDYQQLRTLCPNDIEVTAHNGRSSCTICGPIKSIDNFVADLKVCKRCSLETV